ncbi:putative ubiquinone biosynthesis monooxygenase [Borealophlyctis nickersoniae]|nr:putative ubiquinone biosynthesis monooxygenase [Borealophlyctis nickersoniae]
MISRVPRTIATLAPPRPIVARSRLLHTATAARSPHSHVCDVCIVGGGIVGTALACALASRPAASSLKVALVEAGDLFRPVEVKPNVYSNRVSSLTPGSVRFLQQLGVWQHIDATRPRPYDKMEVWDAVGEGRISFDAATMGGSAIAWILENNLVQAALAGSVRSAGSNIEVFNRAKVGSISGGETVGDWPVVQLEDGKTIRARLLIGADGANSKVREFAKIESVGWDYPQKGIVATLRVDNTVSNDTAWQRFLPTGPIALLPLADGYSSLVWSTRADLAPRICALPEKDFVELVNAAFSNPVPDVEFLTSQIAPDGKPTTDFAFEADWGRQRAVVNGPFPPKVLEVREGSRAPFPLRMRNSSRYVQDRIALIGDAAHTVHPLAGQGLNLGLADAKTLSDVIDDAVFEGQDIGQIHVLEKYAAERYGHNLSMLTAVHGIGRLFGTDSKIVSWIRSTGLNLTNSATPLKAQIMDIASR